MQNETNAARSRLPWEVPLAPPQEQPYVPPNDPSGAGWSTTVPVPVVPAKPEPTEFYILSLGSPRAMELEEKLNAAAGDGWSLFQIIQQKEQMLLVFWRPLHDRR